MSEVLPEEDPQESTLDEKYAAKIPWTAVDWILEWGPQYPDKQPPTEPMFENDKALAVLLAHEVVFLNSFWWEKDWPEKAKKKTSLSVNCNDVFAWGCSDAEDLDYSDIQDIWIHWKQDKRWGPAVWCMKKRGQMPQRPVLASIMADGIWDVKKLEADLKVNYYDTVNLMLADAKYRAYSSWCVEVDKEPLPFDKYWWDGWKEYIAANPKWNEMEWYKIADQQVDAFRAEYNSSTTKNPNAVLNSKRVINSKTLLSKRLKCAKKFLLWKIF